MIDSTLQQWIDSGWLYAALRLLFIGLVYLFLFLLFRSLLRDLRVAAWSAPSIDDRPGRAALFVIDGGESALTPGELLPLHAETVIGRAADNTIVIDDAHVSARHADLRFARGQWWLRDLDSSNGTWLNGEPVRSVVGVRPGDVLQCGGVRLRLIPSLPVPGEDFAP